MRWISRLTSGAFIVAIVAALVLLIRGKVPSTSFGGSFRTHMDLRDGSRLAVGSPVVIAGVRVGVIEKLTVDGRLARIDMVLRDGLDLPADSFAARRADSLFGDSYIEITPTDGEGSAVGPRLKSGDPIVHVIEGISTDSVLRAIDTALPQIDNALDRIHDGTIDSRRWVTGTLDDRLTRAASWIARGNVEDPLASADRAMVSFEDATTRGADAVAHARPQIASGLDRFDRGVAGARTQIADLKTGIVNALHDTRDGLDSIDPQIASATEVVAAINNGSGDDWRGTLGRLVNEPALGEQLDDVTTGARDALAGIARFRSWLGIRLEYDVFSHDVRFYATGEVHPRGDKFYLFEIERGPLGGIPSSELSDAVDSASYTRSVTIEDQIRFTAQYGKLIGPFALRGGVKDSTPGVGADAILLDGRLKFSADLFGSFENTPRLKLAGAFGVLRSLYVIAGIDDALNRPSYLLVETGDAGAPKTLDHVRYGRDWFVGSMLVVGDDDIAALLRIYGALLIGLFR